MRSRTAAYVLCLGSLGCSNDNQPAATATSSPPPSAPAGCAERIAALQTRFATIPDRAPPMVVAEDVARGLPVTSRGLTILEPGPQLAMAPMVTFDGMEIAGTDDDARADAIAERWEQLRQAAPLLMRPVPTAVYVAAAPGESAERVVRLFSKLPNVELRLLVRPADAAPPAAAVPIPPQLANVIGPAATTLDPATRAQRLATALTAAVGTCGALREAFGALASVSPEQKAALAKAAVIEGLQACNCQGVDVDALSALMLATLDPGPVVHWIALPRTVTGSVAAIASATP